MELAEENHAFFQQHDMELDVCVVAIGVGF